MTWLALEHERRVFNELDPHYTEGEEQLMSRGWIIKARLSNWADHGVSWFWIPVGNCAACRFFQPAGAPDGPRCLNPNATIRERFWDYLNGNDCPGFVAGQGDPMLAADTTARDMLDVMKAAGLADGSPSQPVEIIQKVPWARWQSHQARAQQEAFLAMGHARQYGQPERFEGDLGPIEE